MNDRPLTQREEELLRLIVAFVSERGYAPSFTELAERRGRSKGATERMVHNMRRKGRLVLDGHRGIRVMGLRWKPEPAS